MASLLLLISCGNPENESAPQQALPYPVVEIPVTTLTGYTSYPASIEGRVNSGVRAKIPGYITDVLVDEGQKVSKGQPLFKLETASLTQDAEAAQANVEAARVEVNRLKPLVEKNIISEVQLETALARLSQAEASYNSLAANIEYATIRSPLDGYVGSIPFREGALVSPSDPQPLTVVTDINEVHAYFSMNERDYLNFLQNTEGNGLQEKIKNFPPVELQMANGQLYDFFGEIETVSGQVNRSSGTVSFRASFPNPARLLTNGNSGTIRIPKLWENVAVVPETSTFERQGLVYVYKVQGDTMAVSSIIEVADRIDNLLVIQSGIEAGEQIVARGAGTLSNYTPIEPQAVAFDSLANSIELVFR